MKLIDKLLGKKSDETATQPQVADETVAQDESAITPFTVEYTETSVSLSVNESDLSIGDGDVYTGVDGDDVYAGNADELEVAAELTENFLLGMLAVMDNEANIVIKQPEHMPDDHKLMLNVEITNSNEPGMLIGRRGEALDAIQRITNMVVNRETRQHVHIRIDAEGYRTKRADSVRGQAQRAAQRVLKSRKNYTLDPMNAFERHIVHETVQKIGGLSSHSTGSEPNRCVVISYGAGKGGSRYGSR